jgi:hypothetical protein
MKHIGAWTLEEWEAYVGPLDPDVKARYLAMVDADDKRRAAINYAAAVLCGEPPDPRDVERLTQ